MKVELSPLKEVVLSEAGGQANGPCEWEEVRLGEVIEFKRGYDLPQRNRILGNAPVVSSSGITDWHSEAKVKGPGVITGRYGTLGGIYFIRDDFWPLNTALYVRDFKGNDPRFISYFLRSIDFLAYSDKAAVPGLNRNHLHEAIVHYPTDIGEQRSIAHILGTLDDKIELNRRMNQTLEEMARAIYKDWFVDFGPVRAKLEGREPYLPMEVWDLFPDRLVDSELGEIPEGWEIKQLQEFAAVIYGAAFASQRFNNYGKGLPLIRIRDLATHDPTVFTDEQHPKGKLILPGDIVVGMDGEFRAHIWRGPTSWLNQRMCHFQPHQGVPRQFLFEALIPLLAEFERFKVGTTVIHLSKTDIDSISLTMPSAEIFDGLASLTEPIVQEVLKNAAESRLLEAQRDALLPRLVSGEVRAVKSYPRGSCGE